MKKSILALCALTLAGYAFADKVTITGNPVVLEQRGDVYYVPDNYTSTTTYHYVTVGGTNRVCYSEAQTDLMKLNPQVISVSVGGKQAQWTCYDYNTDYFTVTP